MRTNSASTIYRTTCSTIFMILRSICMSVCISMFGWTKIGNSNLFIPDAISADGLAGPVTRQAEWSRYICDPSRSFCRPPTESFPESRIFTKPLSGPVGAKFEDILSRPHHMIFNRPVVRTLRRSRGVRRISSGVQSSVVKRACRIDAIPLRKKSRRLHRRAPRTALEHPVGCSILHSYIEATGSRYTTGSKGSLSINEKSRHSPHFGRDR